MIFQGKAITVRRLENGIAELTFDLEGESVNKFERQTVNDLDAALAAIENTGDLRGVLATSGKNVFIVGADITEFGPLFERGSEAIAAHFAKNNANLNRLEDLPLPVVVAINGFALGGGLEFCLACDYRVAATTAKVGFPETRLGLIPGWGGTVRMPRIAGVEAAVEWIAGGGDWSAADALAVGVIDSVVEPEQLREAGLRMLQSAINGELDFAARRARKQAPLAHTGAEAPKAFESFKASAAAAVGHHYPAPVTAVKAMEAAADKARDGALTVEAEAFVEVAQTGAAKSLVGIFLNERLIGKNAKSWEKRADKKISRAAVLGAGIMGGGIAYQSALTGTPIKMKDIAQSGIDLGLSEADKLLSKRVERGRMTVSEKEQVLTCIEPTLSYDGFDAVDIVVEAVVEDPGIKRRVLAEVEAKVTEDTIVASNTSTISITHLAEALQRPRNFCGMHFFNPVHAMPLVEVIRGEKTSDTAIARTVAYANALGKKAIVIGDCPGFLVNRVLFPYFAGFSMLVRDGADFQQVDAVMEKWGWPMGPAYLLDVVGIDTGVHCETVMAQGFPDRMGKSFKASTDVLYEAQRFGQKNGQGFYQYEPDSKGKPKKTVSEQSYELLKPHVAERRQFSEEDIVFRTMIPMATELARCLEDNIVASVAEADMALVYGLGFPSFRGGVLRWIDSIGLGAFCDIADKYAGLGKLYEPTAGMRELAAAGKKYYEY